MRRGWFFAAMIFAIAGLSTALMCIVAGRPGRKSLSFCRCLRRSKRGLFYSFDGEIEGSWMPSNSSSPRRSLASATSSCGPRHADILKSCHYRCQYFGIMSHLAGMRIFALLWLVREEVRMWQVRQCIYATADVQDISTASDLDDFRVKMAAACLALRSGTASRVFVSQIVAEYPLPAVHDDAEILAAVMAKILRISACLTAG